MTRKQRTVMLVGVAVVVVVGIAMAVTCAVVFRRHQDKRESDAVLEVMQAFLDAVENQDVNALKAVSDSNSVALLADLMALQGDRDWPQVPADYSFGEVEISRSTLIPNLPGPRMRRCDLAFVVLQLPEESITYSQERLEPEDVRLLRETSSTFCLVKEGGEWKVMTVLAIMQLRCLEEYFVTSPQ